MASIEEALLAEKQFHYNWAALCGKSSSVSIDHICNFISYAAKHGLTELYFVEENYTCFFYDADEDLNSFADILEAYNELKMDTKFGSMIGFRNTHRKARKFLDDSDIKERLQKLLAERQSQMEIQATYKVASNIVSYLQGGS
jgi:hypothetical protein